MPRVRARYFMGNPDLALGAVTSFLEPFREYSSPKVAKLFKINFGLRFKDVASLDTDVCVLRLACVRRQ